MSFEFSLKRPKLLIFIVFTPDPNGRTLKISSLEKFPFGDLGANGLFRLGSSLKIIPSHIHISAVLLVAGALPLVVVYTVAEV